MEKRFPLFFALLSCCVFACNSPEPASSETQQAVDTASASPDSTDTTPYDPDPTDSIAAGSYGINSSSAQTASLIRASLQEEYRSDLEKNIIDSISRKFIFFEYDLNDDGYKEIFVGLTGPYFCGSGGCTIYLLDHQSKLINTFTVAGYPIVIDNNKTNGFKDLFIHSGNKDRIVKFDGKKYPSNPSMLPALTMAPGDGLTRALDWTHEPYPWFHF
ncbi:hypothetical protein [Flavihumibacter fluvii]|uniref:hypothetical protein n=1 Tax=Flavihumibacter fluvii TaxID=2838157 RepID=UPI001BDF51EB|nr:hypothetical protein [Flavihumibacter fluvii]ULQ53337.1 hypothetical protein KJS93_03275 [Flavihumibacter fluvii]